ncbi:hypothetical protein [Pontibacillus salipaludis]|uniref:Uncharacterized protein n=1 Tax=Pontibacillus salipaludis TaxID=1697394 RepID=A0ABQ1PYS7_9BACI|nr:hypothetical protein [Pontibacillus salipaludis]GGD07815.1 hypothetical protein GCM10011389_14180 [Pontibacillus salipaludis]
MRKSLKEMIVSDKGMPHINLPEALLEKDYKGAGNALLVYENGELTKLIYENQDCPPVAVDLSFDQFLDLLIDNGVDLEKLEEVGGKVLGGTCSCCQFVFPTILLDMEEL